MRRLLGLLLPALLLVGLLAAPSAAVASDEVSDGPEVVLAAGEPTGPMPAPRDAENNPARTLAGYEDHEVQFTWGAAWILLAAGAFGLTVLCGGYYLLVYRPSREAAGAR